MRLEKVAQTSVNDQIAFKIGLLFQMTRTFQILMRRKCFDKPKIAGIFEKIRKMEVYLRKILLTF